jgi:hypothetical protein
MFDRSPTPSFVRCGRDASSSGCAREVLTEMVAGSTHDPNAMAVLCYTLDIDAQSWRHRG